MDSLVFVVCVCCALYLCVQCIVCDDVCMWCVYVMVCSCGCLCDGVCMCDGACVMFLRWCTCVMHACVMMCAHVMVYMYDVCL